MDALRPGLAAALMMMAMPSVATGSSDDVARWQPLIAIASQRCGVPQSWIARVMHAESRSMTTLGGKPIRSSAGAMGLMQLMPATWAQMRGKLRLGSDPDDPHDNIVAGTCFLRELYDRFGYPGLFAAYNAGPAHYGRSVTQGTALPIETQNYMAALGEAAGHPQPEMPPRAPALLVIRHDGPPAPSQGNVPSLFIIRHDAAD